MPDQVTVIREALLSNCGTFRYSLSRRWGDGPCLLFIMLNPSTADALVDDPTIRRCIGFAKSHGFNALKVVNLFAFRATKPANLKANHYPVGPENDAAIADAIVEASEICLAWGAQAGNLSRPGAVVHMVRALGKQPKCLAITRSGHPQHPLFAAASLRLKPFTAQAIYDAIHP